MEEKFVNIVEKPVEPVVSKLSDIPNGTMFVGIVGRNEANGRLFFKSDCKIFPLDRPTQIQRDDCWTNPNCSVVDYKPVRSVTVTV